MSGRRGPRRARSAPATVGTPQPPVVVPVEAAGEPPADGERAASGARRAREAPEQTRDDTDAGWGEASGSDERWWREQRPPHWE